MNSPTLPETLSIISQLDHAVALLLPSQSVNQEEVEDSARSSKSFVQAVASLQAALHSLRQARPANEKDVLLQEVQALQLELEGKEKLLAHSCYKVQEWQRACESLQKLHQNTLFNFTQ